MRTFWVAQWKTGLQRRKIFDTKEAAEYYRDNCSLNGSVELFEVEERKVANFEIAFGGYSNSDIIDELTATKEAPLFNYPDEWAKAMREGRKFKCGDWEYFYDESFVNPFRISSERDEISDAINASWEHYDKVTEITEPKWYEKDLGEGVWCRVWDNKKEHYDIVKIVKAAITSTLPYESRYTAWKHAEPVSKELAEMLDKEVKR